MNKAGVNVLQERYRLTKEEYEEYYKAVNLFFTTGKRKVENPKLVFVAGQAGAGKSKLIPVVNEQLKYNAVISDYDMVRALHPNFDRACKEVPEDVHLALLPDADQANKDLRNYCKANNFNLIYEGTMRGTPVFLEIARDFKDAGYEVDLSLMSVPKLESCGSTLLRYATDLLQNNSPRWVPKAVHDESYEKFIITLRELEKQSLYDYAEVYRRGKQENNGRPILIYSTEGKQFENAIEAVLYGRESYRKEAISDYVQKHDLVCKIFSEKQPNLLMKLEEWEQQYSEEIKTSERKEDIR